MRASSCSRGRAGRTLELGAGHRRQRWLAIPPAVTELVLTEPDPHMARRLREQARRRPPPAFDYEVVEAAPSGCPSTTTASTRSSRPSSSARSADPARVVREIARVLRPGGRAAPARAHPRSGRRVARPVAGPPPQALGLGRRRLLARTATPPATLAAAGFDVSGLEPGRAAGGAADRPPGDPRLGRTAQRVKAGTCAASSAGHPPVDAAADRRRARGPDRRRLRLGGPPLGLASARSRPPACSCVAARTQFDEPIEVPAVRATALPGAGRQPPSRSRTRGWSSGSPTIAGEGREVLGGAEEPQVSCSPRPAPRLLDRWASDVGKAREAAARVLAVSLAALAAAGIDARGRVGDADPVQAITDELRDLPGARGLMVAGPELGEPEVEEVGRRLDRPVRLLEPGRRARADQALDRGAPVVEDPVRGRGGRTAAAPPRRAARSRSGSGRGHGSRSRSPSGSNSCVWCQSA